MPKLTQKTVEAAIKAAREAKRPAKKFDERGLYLHISAAGGTYWRLRYQVNGKESIASLGRYPDLSLADAREARDVARQNIKAGRPPSTSTKTEEPTPSGPSFEAVAREWHAKQLRRWSTRHANDVMASLNADVFPEIGADPIGSIRAARILEVLRKIEERGAIETAHRVRQRVSDVFVYAMGSQHAEDNPAAAVKSGLSPIVRSKQPAVTELADARKMLQDAEAIPAHPLTRFALRLLAITAVRPGALLGALLQEFEGIGSKEPTWRIPPARMKMKETVKKLAPREHLVPLPRQAVEIIEAIRPMVGPSGLIFPNVRRPSKPMSENAIGYLLNRAGYHHQHVPHGWRSTFSTIMNERYPADRYIIDLMLAHVPKDKVEGAYNRSAHLARRRELAQLWADLLLKGFPPPNELLELPRKTPNPLGARKSRRKRA